METDKEPKTLRRGAVAMFDALGFKGIWRKGPTAASLPAAEAPPKDRARDVIAKLRGLEARARDVVEAIESAAKEVEDLHGPAHTIQVALLSDTIIVGCSVMHPKIVRPEDADWSALMGVLHATVNMLPRAAEEPVPLAFRGSISVGDYLIDGSFVVGEAIDRCAEVLNLAEAAVVWLDPFAKAVVDTSFAFEEGDRTLVRNYPVPLKGGRTYTTHVVNLFEGVQSGEEILEEAILRTFRTDILDVAIKRQNTADFLRVARAAKLTP